MHRTHHIDYVRGDIGLYVLYKFHLARLCAVPFPVFFLPIFPCKSINWLPLRRSISVILSRNDSIFWPRAFQRRWVTQPSTLIHPSLGSRHDVIATGPSSS